MPASISSTHKKIVVIKFNGEELKGFIGGTGLVGPTGIEMIDLEARSLILPLGEIKCIYYVRDFDTNPIQRQRKVFLSRPKVGGLWVRMTFLDNDIQEGVIPNTLSMHRDPGLLITAPDFSTVIQKIYIPKAALRDMKIVGVVTDWGARRARRKATESIRQFRLFQ